MGDNLNNNCKELEDANKEIQNLKNKLNETTLKMN